MCSSDLNDNAFATCTVENVWTWLVGRGFDASESDLRLALTNYFITTNYSFKELAYAVATHPTFMDGRRSNSIVSNPLSEPPLGEPPGGNDLPECDTTIDFTQDILGDLDQCTRCHGTTQVGGANTDLTTEGQWELWGEQAVSFMASGQMPPSGGAGPPRIGPVFDLKEKVRCWLEQKG